MTNNQIFNSTNNLSRRCVIPYDCLRLKSPLPFLHCGFHSSGDKLLKITLVFWTVTSCTHRVTSRMHVTQIGQTSIYDVQPKFWAVFGCTIWAQVQCLVGQLLFIDYIHRLITVKHMGITLHVSVTHAHAHAHTYTCTHIQHDLCTYYILQMLPP